MDIKELLKNIDNSVLTEESKAQICDVFEQVVAEKVETQLEERVSSAVESALNEQDASHTTQLTKVLEAIDADHTDKLKQMATKMDGEYSAKLEKIVEKYENLLTKEAKSLTESLQVDISNFLDITLDDLLPKNMLQEAVQNTKATEKLKKIQELVSIDEEAISSHIKEALNDGKEQIDKLRNDLNNVLKENVRLGAEKGKFEGELVLERKIKSLPKAKRLFAENAFKGKSAGYIEENFDVTLQMFERKETEAIETEKTQVITESVAKTVDVPEEKQSTEDRVDPRMSEYVSGLD